MSCKTGNIIDCMKECSSCSDATMETLNKRNDNCQAVCGASLSHAYADVKSICQCCPRTHIIPCDTGTAYERKLCYLNNGYQYFDEECVTSTYCDAITAGGGESGGSGGSGGSIGSGGSPTSSSTDKTEVKKPQIYSNVKMSEGFDDSSSITGAALPPSAALRGILRHEQITVVEADKDTSSRSVGAELNGLKLGGLHVNALEFMGCDFTFPYDNTIKLLCDTPWRAQQKGLFNVCGGGYLKYEKLTDNIVQVAMNPRQGGDTIGKVGILRTPSIDPAFVAEVLSNNDLSASIKTATNTSYSDEDLLLESRLENKVISINKDGLNLNFDFFTCQYGTMRIVDNGFISGSHIYYVFGLGPITTNTSTNFSLNWADYKRRCNQAYGTMQGFGIYGSHWPVMYVLRLNKNTGEQKCFMVYLDHFRKVEYFFDDLQTSGIIKIRTREPEFRFYVAVEPTVLCLRKQFMKISGPPQPPVQKAMGLWLQKFGYENWADLETDIKMVQSKQFPVDGFIFDLYWFGHKFPTEVKLDANSYDMNFCHQRKALSFANELGKFKWNTKDFPQHREYICQMMKKFGYGATLIEEPYITADAEDFSFMYYNDMIAKLESGSWAEPEGVWNKWIGQHSAMPDYTNPQTSKHWFKTRILPNITAGTFFWWNDLSEPEVYNENALYLGVGQVTDDGEMLHEMHQAPDVLNYNQLLWVKGIAEQYNGMLNKRYNVLCRAGTCGIQRYGAFMWPGDSFPKLLQLNASTNSLANLSLSGLDFSATDAGGFGWNDGVDERQKLYSMWYANSAATNFTLKPHKYSFPDQPTASPTQWGSVEDNLFITVERYLLSPYYYSSAMAISQFGDNKGDPFTTTMFFRYQYDLTLLRISLDDQKNSLLQFVGPSLVYAMLYQFEETSREIYFPKDTMWFDYRNSMWLEGGSSHVVQFKTTNICPLFVKNNSIVPMRVPQNDTINMRYNDVLSCYDVYVYSYDGLSADPFTLYIDDGISMNRDQLKIRLSFMNGLPNVQILSGTCNAIPQFNFILLSKDSVTRITKNSPIPNRSAVMENFAKETKEDFDSFLTTKNLLWYTVLIASCAVVGLLFGLMFPCKKKQGSRKKYMLAGFFIGIVIAIVVAMQNK